MRFTCELGSSEEEEEVRTADYSKQNCSFGKITSGRKVDFPSHLSDLDTSDPSKLLLNTLVNMFLLLRPSSHQLSSQTQNEATPPLMSD